MAPCNAIILLLVCVIVGSSLYVRGIVASDDITDRHSGKTTSRKINGYINSDTLIGAKNWEQLASDDAPGNVYYIKSQVNLLNDFIANTLPTLDASFTLFTAGTDTMLPSSLTPLQTSTLLEHPLLEKWFTQNYDGTIHHPKLHGIPIGFDMDSVSIADRNLPNRNNTIIRMPAMLQLRTKGLRKSRFRRREILVVPHTSMTERKHDADRDQPTNILDQDCRALLHVTLPNDASINFGWTNLTQYRFGVSPRCSTGLDCQLHWEMLFFGMIPIIRSSPLDVLYEGLPVIMVEDDYTQLCTIEGELQRRYRQIQHLWPAPAHIFTTQWWLTK